jgi:actin-related protein
MAESNNIVIDNGSGVLKAGMGGENSPSVKFPAIVGTPRGTGIIGSNQKEEYIGDEAQKLRGVLNMKYPIASGIIQDWDLMNKVWEFCFTNELRVDAKEHRVMLTEAPLNPKANREKMTEVMFETHNVMGLYVAIQAVLSLYANGRTTGAVCDSGDGVSHTVPVFEGFQIPHAVRSNHIAGRCITDFMEKLLTADGTAAQGGKSAWNQIVREIKEKVCFVALDYTKTLEEAGSSNTHTEEYTLPDESIISVNTPRFCAPEGLFFPDKIKEGDETKGLHQMTFETISTCDQDVRKDLYENVILSGGTTLYAGLPERLEKELDALCPKTGIVKVIAPADRYYSVWNGGSTLCSLATFEAQWITKDEYEEIGVEIVHTKCV